MDSPAGLRRRRAGRHHGRLNPPPVPLSSLSLCVNRASKFSQPLLLLPHALLKVLDAPDERTEQSGLIEVSVQNRFAHLGGTPGQHVELARARFHLSLKILEMSGDHLIDGTAK